jgi:hypothetical protein
LVNHRVELDDDIPQSGSLVDGAGRDELKVAELLLKVNGFRVQLGMSDRYEVVVGPAARRRPTSG